MTDSIEQRLTAMYEEMRRREPSITNYKIYMAPEVLAASNWTEGQLVTKYNLTVLADDKIKVNHVVDDVWSGDIWLYGKPVQKRKFRRYKRK